MDIGSTEWDQLTQRRAKLIFKKNREGLDDFEQKEYEDLTNISKKLLDDKYPRPKVNNGS